MFYFITDGEGQDWQKRQWGEGVSFTEENPNYYFAYYDNPLVALFMNPANDEYNNPRVWLAEPFGETLKYDYRSISTGLRVVQEVSVASPTLDQRLAFGLVCALNTVTNPEFSEWALGWLRGRDRSREAAKKMQDELLELMLVDEVAAGHAASASVADEKPELYSACAAHRAWGDSEEEPLDLGQIATIVTMLSPQDIGKMLSGEEDVGEPQRDDPGPHPATEGPGTPETALRDGGAERAEDNHQVGPEDVRHGGLLPGSEAAPPPDA